MSERKPAAQADNSADGFLNVEVAGQTSPMERSAISTAHATEETHIAKLLPQKCEFRLHATILLAQNEPMCPPMEP